MTKPIHKIIQISAPAATVWEVLFSKESYPVWSAFFSEGSDFKGSWEKGSEIYFFDKHDNGLAGIISQSRQPEFLEIEYTGLYGHGQVDSEGEFAQPYIGAKESYLLEENDGGTLLTIDTIMEDAYYDSMGEAWDKALLKVKELAESK